ncbi:unnamed protein product [[Candida] boidinii]|uniref:Unnamed protein product n=1 Tax=Candida boidinii TaxID=5477 RepID=A0ACB5TJ64_CANBO|nr:unnamed protein product [[Candida] boidinii]
MKASSSSSSTTASSTSTSTSATNSNGPLTYSTVATSILEEMIIPMIHEIVAVSMLNEQTIRDRYGKPDNPIYIDTRNPIGSDEDGLNDNGEGTSIGNGGGSGNGSSNNNNSGDRVKRLKNGGSSGGNSSNGNGNGYNDGGSSTPSAVNSAHNSPQPGAPDIGRFQFLANGKDIYSNARQQRYMNGNVNGNGNGSGQSNGQSNGQSDGGVESRYMGVSDNGSSMANGNVLSAVSMASSNNASEIYFSCSNCNRKIAGSRFASHIDRCLGGRTRK